MKKELATADLHWQQQIQIPLLIF